MIEEVVADKGYHSRTTMHDLDTLDIRAFIEDAIAAIWPHHRDHIRSDRPLFGLIVAGSAE